MPSAPIRQLLIVEALGHTRVPFDYLTRIGRAATAALCRVTQTVIIPALA
jgi:hypothetical protein